MPRFFSRHKQTIVALLVGFLYSATIAFATPPGSPYSAGETLDPTCIPGATNCTVTISAVGIPGGSDTQIQFNDAGLLAGSSSFVWDKTTNRLGIGDNTPAASLTVGDSDAFQVTDQGRVTVGRGSSDPTGAAGSLYYRTDTNTLRLYDTAWQDVPTNSYLGTNFYNKDELATDGSSSVSWTNITNAPTIAANSDTQLLNGGQVSYVSGYSFNVSAASYKILGTTYNSVETPVTLGAADGTFDRIDVIAVNTSGNTLVINGTPSASPQKPYVDPDTQLELTFITVGANTVAPSITELSIYAENAGTPTEWNRSSNNAAIVLNSPTSPRNGTVSVNGTSVPTNARLTFSPSTPFDINSTTQLVLYIKSKAAWGNNRKLSVAFANATGQKGNAIAINRTGSFGFDSTSTSAYQQVVIPISNFAVPSGTLITQMTITALGNNGTFGFYIDDLSLEAGTPLVSTNSFTVNTANSSSVTITGNGLVSSPLTATLNGTYIDGNYFKQNGNAFAGLATLGTTDNNALAFKTNNLERLRLTTTGRLQFSNTNNNILLGGGNDTMTGGKNIATGYGALQANTDGFENIGIGYRTLYSNTSGYQNIALGLQSMYLNTTGDNNIALGYQTLYSNTSGYSNIAIGRYSMYYNSTGYSNTAVGESALNNNTIGGQNTALGLASAKSNTTADGNTAIGFYALNQNRTGSSNVAIGLRAGEGLYQSSDISNNTLVGFYAGKYLRTGGNSNILIGSSVAQNLQTGANNIMIGNGINPLTTSASNTINIGNLIFGTGVTGTGTTIAGNAGIGTFSPAYRFDVLQNSTAQTATNRVSNVSNSGATFDTTAGALSSYGTYISSTSTKSTGSNSLTNVGLYSSASGADANYAAIFDQGNVGIGTTTPTAKLAIKADTVSVTGSDLVTNGTFTGGTTGWTLGSCATYGTNNVVVAYTYDYYTNPGGCNTPTLSIPVSLVSGKTYLVTMDLSGVVGGITYYFTSPYPGFSPEEGPFGNGAHSATFVSTYTGTTTLIIANTYWLAGRGFTVDNVSIKEVVTPISSMLSVVDSENKTAVNLGDGYLNTSLGLGALSSIAGGYHNLAFGYKSLSTTTTGSNNIGIGTSTLLSNASGSNNIAIGDGALFSNVSSHNVAIGFRAMYSNTTGFQNVAIGYGALHANTTAGWNTALGFLSMRYNTTGQQNAAGGDNSLYSNTTGSYNTAFGSNSLYNNTTGSYNTALGHTALTNNNGNYNIGIGYQSSYYNETGEGNVSIGYQAGYGASSISNVSNNVSIGYQAGTSIRTNGNNNILIGYRAADILTTGAKNIVIGYDIDAPSATGSNQLSIGNIIFGTGVTGTGTTIAGNIGIGLNNPAYRFDVLQNSTAQTATNRVANFSNAAATFDTTAGALSSYGGYFSSTSTRSAGANDLTNVGLYATASGAQQNNAAIFESGNVGIGTTAPTAKLAIKRDINPLSGTELVTNGTFTGGTTGWTLGDCAAYGTNNVTVTYTACSQPRISTSISLVSGKTYLLTFDLSGATDQMSFYFLNNHNYFNDSAFSNGSNSVTFTSDYTGTDTITFASWLWNLAGIGWTIDNVSIKEVTDSSPVLVTNTYSGNQSVSIGDTLANSFVGDNAGYQVTFTNNSNFFGNNAGYQAIKASNSNFFGNNAGKSSTLANNSNFFGLNAGSQTTNANDSNFFGLNAGLQATGARYSNFFGRGSGYLATSASNSNFFGYNTGLRATNASSSNFIGNQAGYQATNASNSTFFGYVSGSSATNANDSNFFGANAGNSATNANDSNFFGQYSGSYATSASYSNFIGQNAGNSAVNATTSNFFGKNAGNGASNASYSNLIGYKTGYFFSGNNIGSNNIIIGTNISLPNAAANSINIGGVLFGTGTYATTTGNPSITAVTAGKIGIAVINPTYTLQVGNSSVTGIVSRFENSTGTCDINPTTTTLSCSSDINLKKNITAINTDAPFILRNDLASTTYTNTLNKIMNLTPVVYNWNSETDTDTKHAGFIAQEVEQLFPDLVTTDPLTGLKSLGYTGLIPYTIKAIQELGIEVEGMKGLEDTATFTTSLRAWFANAENKITRIFTGEVCLTDESGTTCLNRTELSNLKALLGQQQSASSGTVETPPEELVVETTPTDPTTSESVTTETPPQETVVEPTPIDTATSEPQPEVVDPTATPDPVSE